MYNKETKEMKGDFTGFTFVYNGHSYTTKELGITRVSDGDRYNEPLIPELEDKTIEIPGLDGSYYYGSDFKSRNFPIKIAYDSLNETQFRLMRQIFGVKHTGLLILDEAPYKQYRVKIASPPELDFVCFDERKRVASNTTTPTGVRVVERDDVPTDVSVPVTVLAQSTVTYTLTNTPVGEITVEGATAWEEGTEELVTYTVEGNTYTITNNSEEEVTVNLSYQVLVHTITREDITPWEYVMEDTDGDEIPDSYVYERIYKGEGTIEFVAYYPFATNIFTTLEQFDSYDNVNEWKEASGILTEEQKEEYKIDELDEENRIAVYNGGDKEVGFMFYIPFTDWNNNKGLDLTYIDHGIPAAVLNISADLTSESENEIGFIINTSNGLVEGVKSIDIQDSGIATYVTSGYIYNHYVNGHFFKIKPKMDNPLGTQFINLSKSMENVEIFYNYLYF